MDLESSSDEEDDYNPQEMADWLRYKPSMKLIAFYFSDVETHARSGDFGDDDNDDDDNSPFEYNTNFPPNDNPEVLVESYNTNNIVHEVNFQDGRFFSYVGLISNLILKQLELKLILSLIFVGCFQNL